MSENVVSLRFASRARDRIGNPLNESVGLPKMRPRSRVVVAVELMELREALDALADVPCSFWGCEGPSPAPDDYLW